MEAVSSSDFFHHALKEDNERHAEAPERVGRIRVEGRESGLT